MNLRTVALLCVVLVVAGCKSMGVGSKKAPKEQDVRAGLATDGGFSDDLAFLRAYTDVVLLKDRSGWGMVAVLPKMQGRVMTSSAAGLNGLSFGWINRELVSSGKFIEHMNGFGGEDRFWLGPEGGQYSIFFAPGVPFDLDHWYTPAPIDTEEWTLAAKSAHSATLEKTMQLKNYSGTVFDLRVRREVQVLERTNALKMLGTTADPNVSLVAFESNNKVVNTGHEPWTKETGRSGSWACSLRRPRRRS